MRDMKRRKQKDSYSDDIFAMDSFSSVGSQQRIEPRIGNDSLQEEIPKVNKRKAASAEVRILRDVLLENPRTAPVVEALPSQRPDALVRRVRGYTKTTPQGNPPRAKRSKARQGRDYSGFFRKLSICLIGIFLVMGIYLISDPIKKAFERPIKSVVVEGEFNFISKQRATDLIANEIDSDFLQVDLMRIKRALMNDPWVEDVSLIRRWPDTLAVKITEQKPIARWGKGFLNQRGQIIRGEVETRLDGLPYLEGSEADAPEILQQYQDFAQLLRSRGLEIIALSCDSKKSWRLTLKNNVEVAIGRDQVMEKMQRFLAVYDVQLSHVWADVKAIDVRYSNGVAVRWVTDSPMAIRYLKG